jgi:hypothetical protein
MTYTTLGAFYTILCVILAALKAVMSGEILSGEMKLHPMDLLLKMCPLALMQTGIMCVLSGELQEILSRSPLSHFVPLTSHPSQMERIGIWFSLPCRPYLWSLSFLSQLEFLCC